MTPSQPSRPATRQEIRTTIQEHRGAQSELARRLHVTHVTVSLVLRSKSNSERVWMAAEKLAREIIEGEHENTEN